MHRVQKFIEVSTGRIGYAMAEVALSEASNGAKWNPDPSFRVAVAQDRPELEETEAGRYPASGADKWCRMTVRYLLPRGN